MKRSRDDSEEVTRAVQLVCQRSVRRADVEGVSLTPLEKQVVSMKQLLAPHVLLLVACGYRVRVFGRDSHVISRRCGIMCIPGHPFEYSSVPYTRVNLYVHRLVSMGYHVAFADQESAAVRAASGTKSGIFTRLVSRWYSRATLLPSERVHTNGDVAHAAVKAGVTAGATTAGQGADKGDRAAAGVLGEETAGDGADDGDASDPGVEEEGQAQEAADGTHLTTTTATTSRSGTAGFRAVDASEIFLCFIRVPPSSVRRQSTRVPTDDGDDDDVEVVATVPSQVSANSVESLRAPSTQKDEKTPGTAWDVVLVSFVTQRRLSLTLCTALDWEDTLHRYDVADIVLFCPPSADTHRSSPAGSPPALPLVYLDTHDALAMMPESILRVMQTTLSLHLGPTQSGEEDGKSTGVCACAMPPCREATRRGTVHHLDDAITLYLKPYQLDGVYERLVARTAAEFAEPTTAAADASPPAHPSAPKSQPTVPLSGSTMRALDVFHSSVGPSGSLRYLIDHTVTACGGRRLRTWLAAPLCDVAAIHARQACVEYLVHGHDNGFVEDVVRECNRLGDVEAVIGKLFAQRCTVPEYVRLLRAARVVYLRALEMRGADEAVDEDNGAADTAPPPLLRDLLNTVCSPRAAAFMRDHAWEMDSQCQTPLELLSGLQHRAASATSTAPTPSPMEQLTKLLADRDTAVRALDDELEAARRALKMPGLQFQTIAGTAYLLDVPEAKADHVPADWLVVSRTRRNVRFHTPRIVEAHVQLCATNERLVGVAALEWQQRQALLAEASEDMRVLSTVVELISTLDALRSLAVTSRTSGYTKPTVVPHPNDTGASPEAVKAEGGLGAAVVIRQGRHPVLDARLQGRYVACDVTIDAGHSWLLTGPNMGGKSALMRMVGCFAVLAQIGCYVPAAAATLPVFSGVHCRMGASDAILEGSSTFLMEMEETSRILSAPRLTSSLVLMDELGRGTSSFDGAAVASATLDYLVAQRCTSMFVTHYSYLCDPWRQQAAVMEAKGIAPAVSCFYMGFRRATEEELAASEARHAADGSPKRELIFTYKPSPGVTPSSFGVEVARMAGLPESVLRTAKVMSEKGERALQMRLDMAELRRLVTQ